MHVGMSTRTYVIAFLQIDQADDKMRFVFGPFPNSVVASDGIEQPCQEKVAETEVTRHT